MEKTRAKAKTTKTKRIVVPLDAGTRKEMIKIAKLAGVSLTQALSVVLAAVILGAKQEGDKHWLYANQSAEEWTLKDEKGKKLLKKKKLPMSGIRLGDK